MLVDAARNTYAQTAVAPWSVRPKPGAPVAVPIAAHTSIALPQLLELCRHQLGSQADAAMRIEARRTSGKLLLIP